MRPVDVGIGRLFDSVRDAVILADTETQQIRLWNDAAAHIFGYSTSEALGLRIEDLIPEHLKPRHRAGIARYAATGRGPYIDSHRLLELPALTKSGEEISIEMSLSPIRDISGVDEWRYVLAVIRDVTERKKANEEIKQLNESLESKVSERTRQLEATLAESRETERKLREAETKYRMVVEHLPAVTYTQVVEHNLSVAFVSPQIEAMLGYTPEEYTSRPRFWAEIIHPEDQSHVLAEDARTDETGEPFRVEYRAFTKDGSIVWVRDEAVLVRSEEGNGLFWQGFMLDVTERKQAEQELHEGEERFRTLIRSSTDVIATIKADGTVTYESDSVERVLGYKPEELIGADGFHLVHPGDMPIAQSMFAELLSVPGATRSAEIRGRHRDGSWRYLEVTGTNLLHEPSIASIVTNYHDITERKRAEKRLRDAEEKYRTLVERMPAVTYIHEVDHTGNLNYVSPQMKDLLGYEPEECTSDPEHWIKILHPADRGRVLAERRRTDETGEPFSMEYRQFAKDGRVVWIRDEAAVVRDEEGKPRYWLGIQMDITERKRAEEALKESELRLRTVISNVPVVLFALNWKGVFTLSEGKGLDALGLKPGQAVGRSISELYGDRPEILEDVDRALSGEEFSSVRQVSSRTFDIRHSPLRASTGEILGAIGVAIDITERKRAEEELTAERNLLRTLTDHLPDYIFVKDTESRFVTNNIEHLRLLGVTEQDEALGKTDFDFLPKELAERYYADEQEVIQSGRPLIGREEPVIDMSGNRGWLSTTKVPLRNSAGEVTGLVGMSRDITERKRAEEELREANRRLSELAVLKADFTAMVAHELDTPLAVIRGYAEMLAAGDLEPAERSRALDKIQTETELLGALVDDVRTAASAERDDFAIKAQPVPVRTLLDAAAQAVAALPGNHPLVVENNIDERVWADPNRIGQVLRNLLSNAAKHSPENTPIELRAMPGDTPGRVRIEVVDHGFGIHPDDVPRVFEKFGRGRDRYGRKVAGIGLGLYLSRRIMQVHGSDLALDTTSEDGSVFSFELEAVR